MPLRNRVTPEGEIVAVDQRGGLFGNRGVLHDADRRLVREWQVRRWIACRLEFRGRRRAPMPPGRYTGLFFLDEATSLAAGHRPCAECRHEDYVRFKALWRQEVEPDADAGGIDTRLHAERLTADGAKRTVEARLGDLPDETMVRADGRAWLLAGGRLRRWTPGGYDAERPSRAAARVEVLTPPSTVAVLRAGFAAGR